MSGPYDSGDLDAIQEVMRSPGYALVIARINAELERRRIELETLVGVDASRCQGAIKGLRTALAIPGILKDEIAAQVKE